MESLAKEQMAGLAKEFDGHKKLLDGKNSFSYSTELLGNLMDTLGKMESLPTRNIDVIEEGAIEHVDKCLLTNVLVEEYEKNPNLSLSSVSLKLRKKDAFYIRDDPSYAQREDSFYARREVEKALEIKRKMESFAEKLSECNSYEDFSSFLLDFFNYECPFYDPFGFGNRLYEEYVFRKALLSKIGAKEAGKLEEKIRGFVGQEIKRRTQKGIDFIESIPEARRIREYVGEDFYNDCKAGANSQRKQRVKEIKDLEKSCRGGWEKDQKFYNAIVHLAPALRKKMLEQSPVSEREAEAWFNKNVSIQCAAGAEAKREEVAKSVKLFYRLTGGKLPDKALQIQVGEAKRAYAQPETGEIVLGTDSNTATIMHELGHILDAGNLNQNLLPRFFIKERATGAPQKLKELVENSNYKENEMAHPDTFNDPYVGKIYPVQSSEVTSMFFTFLFPDSINYEDPKTSIMLDLSHSGLIMDLILDKNPPMVKGYNGLKIKPLLTPYMPKKAIEEINYAFSNYFYDPGNPYNSYKGFYSILGFAPASASTGKTNRMILDVVNDRVFLKNCTDGTAEIIFLLIYMYSIGCRKFPFDPSKMRTIARKVAKGTPPNWFVDWCCKIDEEDFIRAFENDTVEEIKKKNSARPQLYKVLKAK